MELIHGGKYRQGRRKARYRHVMLEGGSPAKVFHAAVRWYGLRRDFETEAHSEIILYNSMLEILAQEFSPEWIAREFPPEKSYDGYPNYQTCMGILARTEPFEGDVGDVWDFLLGWDNELLLGFVIAGMTLTDELNGKQRYRMVTG